jgi:GAF domain-containing protein
MARDTAETAPAAAAERDDQIPHEQQDPKEGLAALRRELAERTGLLEEARAQQAATAHVLPLIGGAPADLRAVLDALVERAARLCGAADATLHRPDGADRLVQVAHFGAVPAAAEVAGLGAPLPVRGSFAGRAFADRRTVHVHDAAAAPADEYPVGRAYQRATGQRTRRATPLLRNGEPIGVLTIRRLEVRDFTDEQIALLETFAAQATIAIETVRLFQELSASNAALAAQKAQLEEALERQTATADVLRIIAGSPADPQRVLDAVVERAARLCGCRDATIRLIEGAGLRVVANHGDGPTAALFAPGRTEPIVAGGAWDRAIRGEATRFDDAQSHPEGSALREAALRAGFRSLLHVPMVRHGAGIGVLTLRRADVRPFSDADEALVRGFADQAAIALENARLFRELQESNATLKDALEQQTATAEVLRVIASSPADLQPVLDTIVANAARMCDAPQCTVWLADGGVQHLVAATRRGFPRLVSEIRPDLPSGRAMLEGSVVHAPDVQSAQWIVAERREALGRDGIRSMLAVPLLREGKAIGTFVLRRTEQQPFSERQIALAQTFGDQAVVALENARLFSALHERDERRRLELERASAIQQRLLPARIDGWPGVLEIAHRFRAAVETSGDFYDVLALTPATKGAPEPLQIAVGDVAGKGMAAALVTALARSALHASASIPTGAVTPSGTLRIAGQRLHRDVGASHFVACALAVVEPAGRHHKGPLLRLANAAQAPVLLVRNGRAEELEPSGYRLPLGAEDDGAYRVVEVELRPGDVVVFSSDGLAEAPAVAGVPVPPHLSPPEKQGELFGFDRLAASVAHWSTQAADADGVAAGVWADLVAWAGDEPHHDDMTLLVLRVPPVPRVPGCAA